MVQSISVLALAAIVSGGMWVLLRFPRHHRGAGSSAGRCSEILPRAAKRHRLRAPGRTVRGAQQARLAATIWKGNKMPG